METIKFKGKRIDNEKWVIGDLVHNAFDGTNKNVEFGIGPQGCYPIEVHPDTIGQFICEDINGKEIYSNSTIRSGMTGVIYKIYYNETYNTWFKKCINADKPDIFLYQDNDTIYIIPD